MALNHVIRLLVLSLVLSSVWGCTATMPPVSMTFIDEQDGRPIAGAHVLFHATAGRGPFYGHGRAHTNLFLVEGVTDSAGMVHLPAQEFSNRPLVPNDYDNPYALVFKSGYKLLILQNNRRNLAELQDVTSWRYNGNTLRVRRPDGEEVLRDIGFATSDAQRAYGYSSGIEEDVCAWKNIPRFLVALDRALDQWKKEQPASGGAGSSGSSEKSDRGPARQ
jgi:hypothetical protein